jgi:hypothetical protein
VKDTPPHFRHLPDEELEQRRLKAQVERSERFRKLYKAMDLRVMGHKDGTLEVFWGGSRRSVLPGRGRGLPL